MGLPQPLQAPQPPLPPPLPPAQQARWLAQLPLPSLCMLWLLGMLLSWHPSSCQPKECLLSGQTIRTGIFGRCGGQPASDSAVVEQL